MERWAYHINFETAFPPPQCSVQVHEPVYVVSASPPRDDIATARVNVKACSEGSEKRSYKVMLLVWLLYSVIYAIRFALCSQGV